MIEKITLSSFPLNCMIVIFKRLMNGKPLFYNSKLKHSIVYLPEKFFNSFIMATVTLFFENIHSFSHFA